jgi:hypothetical protein
VRAVLASAFVSFAAHTGVVAWVASREQAPRQATKPADATQQPVEPPPIVVEILAEPVPAPGSATVVRASGPARASTRALASISVPSAPHAEVAASSARMLTMRGGDPMRPADPTLRSAAAIQHIVENGPEVPPPPPEPGTAAHANDAWIRELEVRLASPTFHEQASPEFVERTRLELESLVREREALRIVPAGGGRYRNTHETFVSEIDPDGTVHFEDRPNVQIKGLGLAFDVTDSVMRSHATDPYRSAKLHFLDKTRDERAEIGRRHREEQLRRSAELALRNIERLWATTHDVSARKQGLFELWDDCAESGDVDLGEAGRAARTLILGEIRARLRGADAYTAEELAHLNAHRRSTEPFAPL